MLRQERSAVERERCAVAAAECGWGESVGRERELDMQQRSRCEQIKCEQHQPSLAGWLGRLRSAAKDHIMKHRS
jgi:hypothetical protein